MKKNSKDAKLWKAFSRYIRLRDADENGICKCFTCNHRAFWMDMDCGHGHGRQYNGTKYHEKNNHAQCGRCNLDGGRQDVYKIEVDRLYGAGTWDFLEMAARQVSKCLSAFEIEYLEKHYRAEFEKMNKPKTRN